jgi:hemoglobin/transferrin/lactoferrin receptor protein
MSNMKKMFITYFFVVTGISYGLGQDYEKSDTIINDLDEIIVSANRWEQNLREVANKVSTVNSELVQFQNPQTAADLLTLTNNVFVQKSQLGGGSPMIRGFSTNRVLLVVDGVRMNNAIFRSGNLQNVISLDPNTIEEAEVVFGPGSVLYGSDAIGGVMDFHTLTPKFALSNNVYVGANALARYSSANNERTIHADFNVASRKLSFLSSASRSVFDDLRMGKNGPDEYTRPDYAVRQNNEDVVVINEDPNVQVQSGYDQWNLMEKLSFKPNEMFEINYAFHFSRTSEYPRYDRLILREEDNSLSSSEWYYGPQKWNMHSVNAIHSNPTMLFDQTKLVIGYQQYEESRHNRGFGGARRTGRTESVDAFSVNLDFDKMLNEKFTMFYGAEFITNQVGSVASRQDVETGEVTEVSTRYPNDSKWRSSAAYLSVKYKPAAKWLLNASLRYNSIYTYAKFDKTFFDFPFDEAELKNNSFNESLGIIFSPNAKWKIYWNFSTGFRAPNVDDIGKVFDSEPGNVVVPNPNLEAEYAYNGEVGFAAVVMPSLKFDFAIYRTTLDNAIARGPATFNGESVIDYDGEPSNVLSQQNITSVQVSGIQFSVSWSITKELSASTSWNFQSGSEKDMETGRNFSPTHVPPTFSSSHLTYKRARWKIDLYENFNGEIAYDDLALTERADSHLYAKDANGNPYAPSWWTLNLKGEFELNRLVTLNAGVENIFDERYRQYSSGITAPGRNLICSLRVKI